MDNLEFQKNKYVFSSLPLMFVIKGNNNLDRKKQIDLFLQELLSYDVIFKDLVNYPLKEKERNLALNLACYIIQDEELSKAFFNKEKLPIKKLSIKTKVSKSLIEKYCEYIIAYYFILSSEDYKIIKDFMKIEIRQEENSTDADRKKSKLHRGLVIKKSKKSLYIFTSDGRFMKVKSKQGEVEVGEICEGKELKKLTDFKIHISIFLIILLCIASAVVVEYRRVENFIVVQMTSSIKLHVNSFGKIIYVYSSTQKGREIMDEIDIENRDFDYGISKILEAGIEKNMIINGRKVYMTISGKSIQYGRLSKTNKVIIENNIPILINNAGNEQKLPNHN